jgi:hypothetical protein
MIAGPMRSVGAIGCALVIWLLSQFSASPSWAQGSEAGCKLYAGVAISQVQLASGCPGIVPPRWTPSYDDHFNWCRSGSTYEWRNHEYSARQTALIGCTGRSPRVAMRDCIDYAVRATSQADLAFYKDCNFPGPRWSRDYNFHLNWCQQGQSLAITGAPSGEDEQRRIELAGCLFGPQGITPDQQAIITVHNEQRARHCAVSSFENGTMLGWNVQLAAAAQQYAGTCRRDPIDPTKFAHSGTPGQGESLAWGPGLSGGDAAALWYSEVSIYNFDAPVCCEPPQSPKVGHFTQMVWRTTNQIGCASATCGGQTLWVCRYTPKGNINAQPGPGVTPDQARQSLIDNVNRPCMP